MFPKVPPPGFPRGTFLSQLPPPPHSINRAQRPFMNPQQPNSVSPFNQGTQWPTGQCQQLQVTLASGQSHSAVGANHCLPSEPQSTAQVETDRKTAGQEVGTCEQQGQEPTTRKASSSKTSSTEAFIPLQVSNITKNVECVKKDQVAM